MAPESMKRKLTTILAADVVGYSRLMAANEEATLATLRSSRSVFDEMIARHQGRLFGTAGDAVLAEFGSAVEAVRCAISIQEELGVRNAQLPDDRRMLFRIGVNVGDVIVEGDDLLGDGVNVAARLEGLAPAGGICISGSTFEQVKNKLSIGFEDLGPQEVKNIPHPVSAFRIMAGPVSVAPGAAAATPKPPRPAAKTRRARMLALAGGGVAVIVAGAVAAWLLIPRGPAPLSSFPATISTDEMKASEVKDFMAGMVIQGISNINGNPFTIRLIPDGTAEAAIGRTGEETGITFRETGRWWTENYRFCMQYTRFAQGRRMCPRIFKDGPKLTAKRPDGTPIEWSFHKE